MSNINEQISLVTQTMFDSINYMKTAAKKEDINEFLPIFISLVESIQVLSPILKETNDAQLMELVTNIEGNIVSCTKSLEKQDFQKIQTALQFSLEPLLRNLNNLFKENLTHNDEKPVIIGMYNAPNNPILSYDVNRLKAEAVEAKRQNCQLFYFESKDVDMETEIINARISLENEERQKIQLPDVIYNIYPKLDWNQDATEKWLRKKVPFTTFPIGDKVRLPRKLIRETDLGYLFIPFISVSEMDKVLNFFKKNKKGVFKRAAAARGENIFFVEQKSKDRFVVEVDKKPIIMNTEGFTNWVTKYLIPDYYILQEFRQFKTRDGNPYDFRAHMQKDGEGKWQLTRIYPRIGSKKGILSNISKGGYSQEFKEFLYEEFSAEMAEYYFKELQEIAFKIINSLDRVYEFSLHEVGIDLAIDSEGRIYMHEANPVPQSKYHEKERAVNAIAYAKYLAKNKLFLSNSLQRQPAFDNQFFYKQQPNLEVVDLDKSKVTIGLLYEEKYTTEKYLEACALMAHHANANFYAFKIQDMDYEAKVIKGKVFENFSWHDRVVRYPDVVLDRLRMQTNNNYQLVYEELKNIPLSHNLSIKALNKSSMMEELSEFDTVKEFIIPYVKDLNEDSLLKFIDEFKRVILKPIHGSFALGIVMITKVGNRYLWTENEGEESEYSWTQLKRLFKERNVFKGYLAQQYVDSKSIDGKPIDLRIHLIKDFQDPTKWRIARKDVRMSNQGFKINMEYFEGGHALVGSTTYIDRYVKKNFPTNYEVVIEHIWNASFKIADAFNKLHDDQVHEQAIDLALTPEGKVYLFEINANRPGVVGSEYEIARYIIPFIKGLV